MNSSNKQQTLLYSKYSDIARLRDSASLTTRGKFLILSCDIYLFSLFCSGSQQQDDDLALALRLSQSMTAASESAATATAATAAAGPGLNRQGTTDEDEELQMAIQASLAGAARGMEESGGPEDELQRALAMSMECECLCRMWSFRLKSGPWVVWSLHSDCTLFTGIAWGGGVHATRHQCLLLNSVGYMNHGETIVFFAPFAKFQLWLQAKQWSQQQVRRLPQHLSRNIRRKCLSREPPRQQHLLQVLLHLQQQCRPRERTGRRTPYPGRPRPPPGRTQDTRGASRFIVDLSTYDHPHPIDNFILQDIENLFQFDH